MIDRSKAPSANKMIDFNFPKINFFKTSNEIEVYFVKKEKLPIVYTSLICDAGSKKDIQSKNGTAYLTSLLIDEGAGEFDALQLSDEFEKLGSIFSSTANQDSNDFSLLSLKDNFERSLYLVSLIMNEPHFDFKDFEREKKKQLDRLLQLKDEPSFIASSVFEKIIFENSFYENPEIGKISTVESITLDDVKNFYNENYLANNLKLFVVGNIYGIDLKEILEKYFSKIKVKKSFEPTFTKPRIKEKNFYIIDKKDSAQSEIRIGHISERRDLIDYYPLKIMNTILGGQFSSRINLNLRENKGYTYGASSGFLFNKHSSYFEINTSVNIDNTADAILEIFNEIKKIQEEIRHDEIEFAKSYLIKQYPARFETYSQVGKNIESLVIHNLPLDEINSYQEKLENVDDIKVLEAANKYILPNNLTIVVVGDKEKIIPQLKSKFCDEIIELNNEGEKIIVTH